MLNDNFVRDMRRGLGLESYDATLISTTNTSTGTLGNVRYAETVDSEGLPTALFFKLGFGIPTDYTNLAVKVRFDAESAQYLIYPPSVQAAAAQNINIDIHNPATPSADVNQHAVTQSQIATLSVIPTVPPSLELVIAPYAYRQYGLERTFAGALTGSTDARGTHDSFAACIPAIGYHCIVGIFLRLDHTIQCVASDARITADPIDAIQQLDTSDFQQCVDHADAGALGIAFYYVTGDTAAVEVKPTRDGRQLIDAEDIAPVWSVPYIIRQPAHVADGRLLAWTVTGTVLNTLLNEGVITAW